MRAKADGRVAGVIGTGLFLGTATSLADGGPLGLLLAYIVIGTVCYSTMVCLLLCSLVEQVCLTVLEDFSWGDGCVPSLTGWSYHAGGAIRGPGVIIHDGMELLVQLDCSLTSGTECCGCVDVDLENRESQLMLVYRAKLTCERSPTKSARRSG